MTGPRSCAVKPASDFRGSSAPRLRPPKLPAARWLVRSGVFLTMVGWAQAGAGASAAEPLMPSRDDSRNALVENVGESEHLTGDWAGWRTRLVERGVHLQAGYIGELFSNLSGGRRRGTVFEGLAEGALELDLERLSGVWKNAIFRASGLFPHGASPSGRLIGDVQTASNIDAYDSVALYEVWLNQSLWDGLLSLRAGQMLADAEFAFTERGGGLFNSSFGWPAFVSLNTRNTGPAYFRAAPGLRVRLEPGLGWFAQGGVYDGDTFDRVDGRSSGNPQGVNFRFSGNQGVFSIGEFGWKRPSPSNSERTNDTCLPGAYKVGVWLHTAEFEGFSSDRRRFGHNHGLYLAAEQMIARETDGSDQGLGAFARVGLAPSDRNFVAVGWDAGLQYVGLIPGRDNDALTLGVAGIEVSRDVRRAERRVGAAFLSDREVTIELTYQYRVRPWFSLQPDLQWIHHPGASRALDDALAIGLRTRLTF